MESKTNSETEQSLKGAQEEILDFDKKRKWDHYYAKDLLLNITEEVGEAWDLIKFVNDEKQQEIVKNNPREFEDFIGDILFLVLKLANQFGVDSQKALRATLDEYEERFPVEETLKKRHANRLAGGIDKKYD